MDTGVLVSPRSLLRPPVRRPIHSRRFAARVSALASGLALAIRPAGSALAPGSTARRRRVRAGPRGARMRSTVDAGGPTWIMRGVPGPLTVTFARRRRTQRERDGQEQLVRHPPGDVAVGTSCGRCWGKPGAAAAAPVGPPPGRARAKLPPRSGEPPATRPASAQSSRPIYSPPVARASSRSQSLPSGVARRRRALEKRMWRKLSQPRRAGYWAALRTGQRPAPGHGVFTRPIRGLCLRRGRGRMGRRR